MIIGKKSELLNYKGLNKNLDTVIDYVFNFDPKTPDGRYEIDGKNAFVNVITEDIGPANSVTYEAHRKYIDLQYVISGSEDMWYSSLENCTEYATYNDEKDVLFVKGDGKSLNMTEDDFYILYPFDCHMPSHSDTPSKLRKIVAKALI